MALITLSIGLLFAADGYSDSGKSTRSHPRPGECPTVLEAKGTYDCDCGVDGHVELERDCGSENCPLNIVVAFPTAPGSNISRLCDCKLKSQKL
jgi:hypothetical protein